MRSYEPELKRQSIEWQSGKLQAHRGLQSFGEYKSDAYELCIRYSGCSHEVPSGKRVNDEYYKEYIQKYLRPAIRKKQPELLPEGLILLHGNATQHKTGAGHH